MQRIAASFCSPPPFERKRKCKSSRKTERTIDSFLLKLPPTGVAGSTSKFHRTSSFKPISLILEGNRYLVVVEDLYAVAPDLFRRVPRVNADGWIYPESGLPAALCHGCNGSVSYVHLRCDMKGSLALVLLRPPSMRERTNAPALYPQNQLAHFGVDHSHKHRQTKTLNACPQSLPMGAKGGW